MAKKSQPSASTTTKSKPAAHRKNPIGRSHQNAKPRNDRERHARERALASLALMRRKGLSLRVAAREEGTSPATVLRYVGSAIQKGAGGRYHPTKRDRIARTVRFLSPHGQEVITVRSSRDASRVAEFMNAVSVYLRTGDTTSLMRFQGKTLRADGGIIAFVTDTAVLDELANAGELAGEGLYRAIQKA